MKRLLLPSKATARMPDNSFKRSSDVQATCLTTSHVRSDHPALGKGTSLFRSDHSNVGKVTSDFGSDLLNFGKAASGFECDLLNLWNASSDGGSDLLNVGMATSHSGSCLLNVWMLVSDFACLRSSGGEAVVLAAVWPLAIRRRCEPPIATDGTAQPMGSRLAARGSLFRLL